MSFRQSIVTAIVLSGLMAGVASVAHADSISDAIAARQANRKKVGDDAGAIKKALDTGGDLKSLASKAQEIADFAKPFTEMFPAGSSIDSGLKTTSLPSIWANKADFDAKSADNAAAALKLVAALNTGDKATVLPAFQAMGATCGACHKAYRKPQ